MNEAVIDLGTNTFNLLIYTKKEQGYTILHTERQPAALGEGGIKQKMIQPQAFERGVNTLLAYKKKCDDYDVTTIKAFGTSALREATNGQEFKNTVLEKVGITVEIISGQQEAKLIYNGVKQVHTFDQLSCVMDIGGGSTEFIFADKNGVVALESFNIGVARMLQSFSLNDPLSPSDIEQLEHFLSKETGDFFDRNTAEVLIGASGSFDTFYELLMGEAYTNFSKSCELPTQLLLDKLDELIASSYEERDNNPRILDIRKKMVHIAALKTRWVIRKLGVKAIWISPASLKEGAVLSEFDTL